jgi:hypothetical protein
MRARLLLVAVTITIAGVLGYVVAAPRLTLYHYGHADPLADADRAARGRDFRLVGVQGRGLELPGADSILGVSEAMRCAARVVPFTSDVISSDVIRDLNGVARTYAHAYNVRLLTAGPDRHCTPAFPA